MVADMLKFNRIAPALLKTDHEDPKRHQTLKEFVVENGLGEVSGNGGNEG